MEEHTWEAYRKKNPELYGWFDAKPCYTCDGKKDCFGCIEYSRWINGKPELRKD